MFHLHEKSEHWRFLLGLEKYKDNLFFVKQMRTA